RGRLAEVPPPGLRELLEQRADVRVERHAAFLHGRLVDHGARLPGTWVSSVAANRAALTRDRWARGARPATREWRPSAGPPAASTRAGVGRSRSALRSRRAGCRSGRGTM